MSKIRITRTEVLEYIPDLSAESYVTTGCKDIEEAMDLDRAEFENGEIDLIELGAESMSDESVWEIVEDE